MKQRNASRRGLSLLVAAVLAVLMVAGCNGNREAALVGNWKIDAAAMGGALDSAAKSATTPQQKMGVKMAKQMMGNITLDLKQDKTFTMNLGLPMEGTWAFDNAASAVSLRVTKVMGMDPSKMPGASKSANQPLALRLSADNKQLTMQEKSGRAAPTAGAMIFNKQ